MKSILLLLLVFLFSCEENHHNDDHGMPHLVTTQWLADRLEQPDLVLIHVGKEKGYDKKHIRGAVWIDLKKITKPEKEGALSSEIASVQTLDSLFEAAGISDNSTIVLYHGKKWLHFAGRFYLTLDYLGLGDQTYILDGGIKAWKEEKRPTSNSVTKVQPGNLNPRVNLGIIAGIDLVKENYENDKLVIIDARSRRFFDGKDDGKGFIKRPGHIPGAKNLPYTSLTDEGRNFFRDTMALRQELTENGVTKDKKIIIYCHVGHQASLVYFVARNFNYKVALFDGSYEEWGENEDLPIEIN